MEFGHKSFGVIEPNYKYMQYDWWPVHGVGRSSPSGSRKQEGEDWGGRNPSGSFVWINGGAEA